MFDDEITSLLIGHEYFWELLAVQAGIRDVEADVPQVNLVGEKVYG